MNPNDEKKGHPYPSVTIEPAPAPGYLDPSAIVAISMSRDEVTFDTYDRTSRITISGTRLRDLRGHVTPSERRELDRKVREAASTSSGEISFAAPPAPGPGFTVPPGWTPLAPRTPEPTVSETLAAQTASDSGPAASAKAVMNALTKMGATSDDALAIILAEIAASDDPFKASGDWIAKITNAANAVVKEVEGDEQ